MNLDGTAPLDVVAKAGARIEYLTPAALSLLALGALCLIGAIRAFRRPRRTAIPTVPPSPSAREREVQPLVLNASVDPVPGRWLWTVKWILLVPHVLLLTGLWAAFVLTTVAAGACVLLTQRYPRHLFDFNVGVLRWTWRVGHYGYLALGTDRYPPFTLRPTPYPATLTVTYPERLSRWLVLVKWLLVVPHLLIVGVVVGTNLDSDPSPYLPPVSGGLVGAADPRGRRLPHRGPSLSPRALRPVDRAQPMDLPRARLPGLDDRRLPALPARPGRDRRQPPCHQPAPNDRRWPRALNTSRRNLMPNPPRVQLDYTSRTHAEQQRAPKRTSLRLVMLIDGGFLALVGTAQMTLELVGYHLGVGPFGRVFNHSPYTIGWVEAHGLRCVDRSAVPPRRWSRWTTALARLRVGRARPARRGQPDVLAQLRHVRDRAPTASWPPRSISGSLSLRRGVSSCRLVKETAMMPDTQPKVAGRSWLRFLIGFTLLWGVLAGISEIDATGRWGLAIFAGRGCRGCGRRGHRLQDFGSGRHPTPRPRPPQPKSRCGCRRRLPSSSCWCIR